MQLRNQQSATESYAELASKNTNSYLVDVRSSQEWQNDGVADLSNNQEKVILCEWRKYPSMELNEDFFSKLQAGQEGHGAWPGTHLLLLSIG